MLLSSFVFPCLWGYVSAFGTRKSLQLEAFLFGKNTYLCPQFEFLNITY